MRTYRHAPNTGSRKSWAAGDATSRAVRHAFMALKGEMGYPSALSAKTWGFSDVCFAASRSSSRAHFGSYVMEHVLFKISFPAEFHAQTAVEAAVKLHPQVRDRLEEIERDRASPRTNRPCASSTRPARCIIPPTAIIACNTWSPSACIFGGLTAEHYEDAVAADPRIDTLREKMIAREEARFIRAITWTPKKRSIANAVQVFFRDGSSTERVEVHFPIGHRRRRAEGIPLLVEKFARNLASHFPPDQISRIMEICNDSARLDAMPVRDFSRMFVHPG